ncbi:sulfotransferase family protein [Opitutaceae bacterium EW11]|nr:sulfotransferase family protein [Opitutaceae bacterium EW11]
MKIRVVGAGLPRTGTLSLKIALERLLHAPCCHMSEIPGQPFSFRDGWEAVMYATPDWARLLAPFVATVDWPGSLYWREIYELNPEALVVLSVRDSAESWWQSVDRTVLRQARMAASTQWRGDAHLVDLLRCFAGSDAWDDPVTLKAAYERHNAAVRASVPNSSRLLEWRASEGWLPICRALGIGIPDEPFPCVNRTADWPAQLV